MHATEYSNIVDMRLNASSRPTVRCKNGIRELNEDYQVGGSETRKRERVGEREREVDNRAGSGAVN